MPPRIDLVGQRFGRLIVLAETGDRIRGAIAWSCICDCGKLITLPSNSLRSGNTQSCGCLQPEKVGEAARRRGTDLLGQRFSRLLVIAKADVGWICRCDCGEQIVVLGYILQNGLTKSCGCLKKERAVETHATHRCSDTRVYSIWRGMIQRCTNPNATGYEYYGGRGIKVCERWFRFENFLADMGFPPEGLTIERIDNDRNYEASNCYWATWAEQGKNKRPRRPKKQRDDVDRTSVLRELTAGKITKTEAMTLMNLSSAQVYVLLRCFKATETTSL